MILYLETSNLVKLYVTESGSEGIKKTVAESDGVATSIVSYVEARAAFARKEREKAITPPNYQAVKADLERDRGSLFVHNLTDALIRSVADLSEMLGLGGYNAIHLASALELKTAVAEASADDKLCGAAHQEGLG